MSLLAGRRGLLRRAVAFAAAVVSMAVLLPSGGGAVENMEEVDQTEAERIEVPALETDDFLWEQLAPRFSSPADDASSETRESDTIAESTTETEAETTVQETTAQETASPETVSPETTVPETAAPGDYSS